MMGANIANNNNTTTLPYMAPSDALAANTAAAAAAANSNNNNYNNSGSNPSASLEDYGNLKVGECVDRSVARDTLTHENTT